ncbi:hypothetical protein [Nocardiopsis sp. Huas11]|uniref:hypothetical protein n=1 Tax=Nocardiopsis sp. Huas11 TaxID=2183912 RepID=UPI000EB4F3DF|nr:hypothetical protein [Nocardiopsis sp. Huas11]
MPYAAAVWGVVYACVLFAWTAAGTRIPLGPNVTLPVWVPITLAGLALLSAGACLFSAHRDRTGRAAGAGPVPAVVSAVLVVTAGALVLATFGAPMVVVSMVAGTLFESGPVGPAHLLLTVVGAGLLLPAALAHVRRSGGRCPRCGRAHRGRTDGPLAHPEPSRASARVRVAVLVAMSGILPWAGAKVGWSLGWDVFGVSARAWHESSTEGEGLAQALAAVGIDITVLAALLVCVLMLGLTHAWGQAFPRWTPFLAGKRVPRVLPLAPALLTGVTLTLYGLVLAVLAAAYLLGIVDTPEPAAPFTDALGSTLMIGSGGLAFGGLGVGLLVAGVSYTRRTRPVCAVALRTTGA